MIIIKEYITVAGRSSFGKWFDGLDNTQALKVKDTLDKLANGKTVTTKFLGNGLSEIKINYGGGLRVYYAKDGEQIILLLGGGAKDSQSRDIENARNRLADYEMRKEQENG